MGATTLKVSASIAAVALVISSCGGRANDPRICSEPRTQERDIELWGKLPPDDLARNMGFAEGCVHRWAYRLAAAKEPAEVVAKAVTEGACRIAVSRTPYPDLYRGEALFHVVQARAGRCKIP